MCAYILHMFVLYNTCVFIHYICSYIYIYICYRLHHILVHMLVDKRYLILHTIPSSIDII